MLAIPVCLFQNQALSFVSEKVKLRGEKSRELKPEEFGQNLKTLLDKKLSAAGKVTTIATFMENLSKIS